MDDAWTFTAIVSTWVAMLGFLYWRLHKWNKAMREGYGVRDLVEPMDDDARFLIELTRISDTPDDPLISEVKEAAAIVGLDVDLKGYADD